MDAFDPLLDTDLTFPVDAADGAPICSFGRVLLDVDVPLPEI